MNDYKIMIDAFISKDYDLLHKISISYCNGTQMSARDLVSELILYLYNNEVKVKTFLSCETSLIRFSKVWMWNQIHLFTKNKGVSNFKSKFQIFDSPNLDELEIEYEGIDYSLRSEYEKDLSRFYTEEQIDKILFANNFVKELNEIEKRLFYLHFEQRLSHTKIAIYLQEKYAQKVSPSSVYNMLVQLRQKIKNEYDRTIN